MGVLRRYIENAWCVPGDGEGCLWSAALVQRFGLYLFIVLMACGRCAFGAPASVDRVVLECGLEVVVFSQEGFDRDEEGIQVWVRMHTGSMSERDHERGAAMMASRAAMFGVGGVGGYSADRMLEMFDLDEEGAIGGEGVIVTQDHLAFMLGVDTADDIGLGLGLARGLVDGYQPSDAAIEKARGGMIGEIDTIEREDVEQAMSRVWLPELIDHSGYSRVPLASRKECAELDADSVRAFVSREWTPGQASVLVVGDVDAGAVIAEARRVFDGCVVAGGRGATDRGVFGGGVPMIKTGLGGRVVTMSNPGFDSSRIGMVWFGPERERVWDDEGYRDLLKLALAGEAVRYRINRLMRRDFAVVEDASVDVGELLSRVGYGQIFVEMNGDDGEDWESVLAGMEIESRRLVRDGLSDGEVERAREWLIQQWGYEIDQWRGSTAKERTQTLDWMMALGRPLVDLEEWVGQAGIWLEDVDSEQINGVVGRVFGEVEPVTLLLVDSEEEIEESAVQLVLDDAGEASLDTVGGLSGWEDWVDDFRGPILNRSGGDGEVEEISVHQASGVVSAVLSNGVVVHHREMVDAREPGLMTMVVRIGFDSIEDAAMHGAGDVFAAAIEQGAIRSRTEKELRGILIEHGIKVQIERGTWEIEIGVTVPEDSFGWAVEFVRASLTDLRIEQVMIESLAREGASGVRSLGVPVHATEVGIGKAFGVGFQLRDPHAFGKDVDARSVRKWIAEQVRGENIEVGIAGGADVQETIEVCAAHLGGIPEGDDGQREEVFVNEGVGGEETITVCDASGVEGVMVGFGACRVEELGELRALTVAGMVLESRLGMIFEDMGGISGGLLTLDLVPGRVVMIGRIECDPGSIDQYAGAIERVLEQIAVEGLSESEIERPLGRIGGMFAQGFDRSEFWASRLSRLGRWDGDVESIWSIREAYQGLDAEGVNEVFRKWYRDGEHFRVEIVNKER